MATPVTLTIRPGSSRTITQRFVTSGFFSYEVIKSNAASADFKVCGACFKTGDPVSVCPDGACQPSYTPKTCPAVISTTVPDDKGCSVLTVANMSLPVGSTGSIYSVPKLKGMWLSLDFVPCLEPYSMTGPVRAVAGSNNFVIIGGESLAIGQTLIGNGIISGNATVRSIRLMTDADGSVFSLVTLDKTAIINALCGDLRTFGIQGNTPITIKGVRSKTSNGQGTCGGLQIEITNAVSTAISKWGTDKVGRWVLKLNNGFAIDTPTTSIVINEGDLWVS